jgi:phosphatidylserine decarboxylase
MRIHREGYSTVLPLTFVFLLAVLLIWLIHISFWAKIGTSFILMSFLLFVFRFFRRPDRVPVKDSSKIISPADGLVVSVTQEFEPEYFKNSRLKIAIFMSGNDVHINWSPIEGQIPYYVYHPGKHLLARNPKSSDMNEKNSIVIQDGKNSLLMKQIAGIMARRVVSYVKPGIQISQGDEIGFIKLGSRVEIFLPEDTKVLVQPGQKVIGRQTILAEWI